MIHYYSLGRAARYFPEQTALVSHGTRSTFRELHERVAHLAGAVTRHGVKAGDRLAILLPNESDYIEGELVVYGNDHRGLSVMSNDMAKPTVILETRFPFLDGKK